MREPVHEAVPGITPVQEPVRPSLRRWAAYQFAMGAIKSYNTQPAGQVMVVVEKYPGHLVEVLLEARDFADIFRAPLGRWFLE
jgi:hypothetical protein